VTGLVGVPPSPPRLGRVPLDLLAGEWVSAEQGRRFPVIDPATEDVVADVADASPADARRALEAAVIAGPRWAASAPRERANLLLGAADILRRDAEPLAELITTEMGKPLAEARGEIVYATDYLDWYAGEALRLPGDLRDEPRSRDLLVVDHAPVGPCLLITPWNFPIAMAARKVAPAIAAGCSCVLKPAEKAPLGALALADALVRAGLPSGVLNVVTTTDPAGVVEPLLQDRRLRKLSFTGSTAVGRRLGEQAGAAVLRVSLELGGNAPFLVFADADVDAAVSGALVAKLRNGGQACTAANRFLVAERVAQEFVTKLAARFGELTIGSGLRPAVDVGPLVDQAARRKVERLVADAVERGARAIVGGSRIAGRGWFFAPTVLTDVPQDAELLQEEIFGPVAAVRTFVHEGEAIAEANATEHGLAAYVFTRDIHRALRVARRLDAGLVGLNRGLVSSVAAPFGGSKASGVGREGGREGIREYVETRCYAVAVDEPEAVR